MRAFLAIALVLFLGMALVSPAAAFDAHIPYSGQLADDQGAALTGSHSLTFRLYDAVTGGTLVWSETHAVTVSNGYFSVELGAVGGIPLDSTIFDGSDRFLEVQVDGGTPLSPRKSILPVAYAVRADEAAHAALADHALTADALTSPGGSGGNWFVAGSLLDVYNGNGVIAGYPIADYEYGIKYSPSFTEPVPVLYASWNSGRKLVNKYPLLVQSDNPSAGMEWGGFLFYHGTQDPADDSCTSTAWRHAYWKMNPTGSPMIVLIGGNGCVSTQVWARAR